jgi:hypothetical protein
MSDDFGIAIGVSNYFGNKRRSFKLKPKEDNVYRPLMPIGEAAKKGQWLVPYAVHWGDKDSNGKMKPYICIQQMRKLPDGTKQVTKRCPRCEKNAKIKDARDQRAAAFKAKGMSERDIAEKLTTVDLYLRQFNRGFRFYMNALNLRGEIGRLDIPAVHADQLRDEISKLLKKGVDATSPAQGAYFNFYYVGPAGHTVTPWTEAVEGQPGMSKLALCPLTENTKRALKDEYWNLLELFVSLTEAEIQRLVDGEGNPEVVDNIFSAGKVESTPVSASIPASAPVLDDIVFDDGLDDLVGGKSSPAPPSTLNMVTSHPAPPAQAIKQAVASPPPAANIANMSDDDFAKRFGI